MKKKQKENLIRALQEVNAPDKKELLERIEVKQNFRREYEAESRLIRSRRSQRASRRALVSACIAGAVVFVIIASLIASSLFMLNPDNGEHGGGVTVDGERDYKSNWQFKYSSFVSFDDLDVTLYEYDELFGLSCLYEYKEGWSVTKTQITQDEKSFREYYTDGEFNVEVTIFTKLSKIPANDTRYKTFLEFTSKKTCPFGVVYYGRLEIKNSPYSYGYAIYKENAVYVLYSDKDLFYGVF